MRPVPAQLLRPIAKCERLAETNEAAPDDARRQMRSFRWRPARHDLPGPNPVHPGPGPEKRLHDLQRRFRAVSAPDDRVKATIATNAAIVPEPVTTTLRHIAAAPNCAFGSNSGPKRPAQSRLGRGNANADKLWHARCARTVYVQRDAPSGGSRC
jgi:hypothetical protein